MLWAGYVAIAVALVWIMVKLYVAYSSSGGTIMAVVYDAAVYPPVIGAIGVYLVLSTYKINVAFWIYGAAWAITTGVVVGAIRLMEEIGDKPL